jgi:hypothetical protein
MRPDQLSDAAPQLNVVMRLGGTIGVAVLAVVLQRAGAGGHHAHSATELARAFDAAYWWALGMAALTLIPAFMLRNAERSRAIPVEHATAVAGGDHAELAQPIEPLGA